LSAKNVKHIISEIFRQCRHKPGQNPQRVIAEGVETPEQQAFLVTRQCDEAQGYYLGHPMVAESFAELLQNGLEPSPPSL
jgi:EAL domain-containing protein (putative c-di-GMP-specific phosphodiesterase class I)